MAVLTGTAFKNKEFSEEEGSMDFEFVADIKGGSVPKEYIPGVPKGIESVLGQGVIAGFPVLGMKATLVDGAAYHDVDSSVMLSKLPDVVPLEKVSERPRLVLWSDILGDINSRRGLVGELGDRRNNVKTISAQVPLANMFQYVSTLQSMSKGRANYSMKLANYDFVPQNIEDELKKGFTLKHEDH